MATTAIDVRELVVRRGRREVLRGLSFTVPRGTVVGVLGPSGSGKSTLLRAVVGTQVLTSGEVHVLGHRAGDAPLRHSVGYVTQSPSVYSDLTVRENARYHAALHRLGRDAAERALVAVGLDDAADQLVATLSGGQQGRASLACALIGTPDLLVLDEPTVGLDPVLREQLWEMFRSLAATGTTLLVSSHVMDEAARCDRLLLLRAGVLIADDTPDAVLATAGTHDLNEAFLRLIRTQEAAAA